MSENAIEQEMHENVDKLKNDVADTEDTDIKENEEVIEYSAAEQKAMAKGWNPDKESVPEGKDWIPAEEFLRNESFFTEIRKLKRELNNTKKTFDVLKEHHKKVAEIERANAIESLKQRKKIALEEDDHDAVVDIDDKILDIKSQKDDPVDMQEGDNAVFEAWVDQNTWYETNPDMRQMADQIGAGYYAQNNNQGNIDLNAMYTHVEKAIKKMYPDEFGVVPTKNKARNKPTVEGATASRGAKAKGKSKFTERDLSDEQRQVMNRFVKTGALTKEAYIDELVKIGELG